jgi:hypothetical protein
MAVQKPIQLVGGKLTEVAAKDASAGAGDAGKVVALDSAGKIDLTMMPAGIGPDIKVIVASEDIAAGKYVNIYDNLGIANIRLADNSNGRQAHGFLKDAVLTAGSGTVYFESANTNLVALVPGTRMFLATAGGVTATPPTLVGGAVVSQYLGLSISATEINTDIEDGIILA